jgi:F-type H+-transporting ATPase subunit a
MTGLRALVAVVGATVLLSFAAPSALSAQRSALGGSASRLPRSALLVQATVPQKEVEAQHVDFITPHISDGYEMDLPYWKPPFALEVCIGRKVAEKCGPLWDPVKIGSRSMQLSPTKHVVMLFLAATICVLVLVGAARSHVRHTAASGHPKGAANGIEAAVLYLRNEVILPTVGPHGERYVPYLLTVFFFILFANLLGLIPYGATATGNISVTATLALVSFIVIEVSGIVALGPGYLSTIFYWNKDLGIFLRVVLFLIMTPVEIMSKLTKPFALAIRLFANMVSGHIVVLAFIGLIFTFGALAGLAPFAMAVGIMLLELLVAFLQAFIFTLLTSSFIGQIREAAH